MTDNDKQLELEVEAEIEMVLARYAVSVELHDEDTSDEVALCCSATRKGKDDVLAHLTIQLPVLSRADENVMLTTEAQHQFISLAVVAMAKLLLIQEQTRPEFSPYSHAMAEA